jgi:glycosyltransferase involved in cell wall biosynthesis
MEKIDVVMLAWNFNEDLATLTESAIHSLKESPMGKLIIVDNNSTVRSGMLREYADICIKNKENLGYPAAVNQGVALSGSEYIAIANNDIRVSPNWVEVANKIFENPKVGTVHFRMIPYDEPIVEGKDVWVGGKERWCHSSFFVVRREAFQGYDEAYGKGGFDDYSHHFRMREKGWIQAYTNKVSFQHMDSITYRTCESPEERAVRDNKNREYYKEKFGEYPDIQFNKQFADQVNQPYFPFP